MLILKENGSGRQKKVNAKFSKGVDFWKFRVLTERRIEAKKLQKNEKNLHGMGVGVQKLTYFNSRRLVESSSWGLKKGAFRAKMDAPRRTFFSGNFEHYFFDESQMLPPPTRSVEFAWTRLRGRSFLACGAGREKSRPGCSSCLFLSYANVREWTANDS